MKSSIKKSDLGFCLFLLVCWILPLIITNLTQKKIPLVPRFISGLYSTSNLFTKATFIWPQPFIQILREGEAAWITLPEQAYFPMETFGYRSRLFEALFFPTAISDYTRKTEATREELARWIALRYVKYHPAAPKPVSVRFVAGLFRVKSDSVPSGRWGELTIDAFSAEDRYVISRHETRL